MNIFTYGSLMFESVWRTVVRGAYRSSLATVHGFERRCVSGENYPAMVVSRGAAAFSGRLYFDVEPDDVARLDHFETSHYARVPVVTAVGEQVVVGEAYLGLRADALSERPWTADDFEKNGLAHFLKTYAVEHKPPG
jgi:gamma-glutamylcyclotransferase (GGCT)/AIG2-like uncharacterized protein YtfP